MRIVLLVIESGGGLKGSARHNRADGAWRFSKVRCCPQFQLGKR